MKYEAQVSLCFRDPLVDDFRALGGIVGVAVGKSVELLPEDECAFLPQRVYARNEVEMIGQLHCPLVSLGHIIKIPNCCTGSP